MPPVGSAEYPAETESNNLKAIADALAAGTKGFTASLHPLGDIDVFSIDIPAGSELSMVTSDGSGGCPPGAGLYVRIFGPSGLIATKSGGCPALSPVEFDTLTALTAGTYYVQVESLDISLTPFYVIDIKELTLGCGDGVVQMGAGENCDDANTNPGDGCDATCLLELNLVPESEPNDMPATANSVDGFDGAKAAIEPIGDVDYYSFNVTVPGSSVFLDVSNGLSSCPDNFDPTMTLYDPNGQVIVTDNNGGADPCSRISPVIYPSAKNLAVGTYQVSVNYLGDGGTTPFYVLKVSVKAPGCGDFVVVAGEQCDDGNNVPGDGCDAACLVEPPWELEPNETSMTATPQWPGTTIWRGSIGIPGDRDYFSFNFPGGGATLTLQTHSVNNAAACPGDTEIHLMKPNGLQEIASDDDDGIAPCSKLSSATDAGLNNLPAGTYYVWVQEFGDDGVIPSYELSVKIQ